MAAITNVELWTRIGNELKEKYSKEKNLDKYFTNIGVVPNKMLTGIDPVHDEFFGTKVCILFIIGKPYGITGENGVQTINWPPEGYQEAKDHLKLVYPQWAKFQLHFYPDGLIVQKALDADPVGGAKFKELMEEVFARVEEDCEEMKEYGWFFEDKIETEVSSDYFHDILDKFYLDKKDKK